MKIMSFDKENLSNSCLLAWQRYQAHNPMEFARPVPLTFPLYRYSLPLTEIEIDLIAEQLLIKSNELNLAQRDKVKMLVLKLRELLNELKRQRDQTYSDFSA